MWYKDTTFLHFNQKSVTLPNKINMFMAKKTCKPEDIASELLQEYTVAYQKRKSASSISRIR